MGGLVYLVALSGLLLLFLKGKGSRLLALLFFGAGWLAPLYHIYSHEPVSLDKHIAYSLFFAIPLAGYALAWLSGYERKPFPISHRGHWLAGAAIVLVVLTLGLQQSHTLYGNWANTSPLSYSLRSQLRNGSGRVLSEDIEVARYDARNVTKEWQWSSFYYPYYVDHKQEHLFGQPALTAAINDRYYDLVELSFNYMPGDAYFAAEQMARTRNYDLVGIVRFQNSYGKGHFFLFRSAIEPGQGTFTSVDQTRLKRW
jgi:hypothetical protein